MSLMRLLTVTRSIKTVKNQPSPYRMKQDHLLPKFAPSKEGEIESACINPAPGGSESANQNPMPSGPEASKRGFLSRWLTFGKRFPRRQRPNRLPVQTELLLEAVRVVRNDFSDNNAFSSSLRHRQAGLPKTQTVAGHWWLRIQTRLFAQRRKPS
jgi:hypothetical protein